MLEQASPLRDLCPKHFMSQYSMGLFVVGGVIKAQQINVAVLADLQRRGETKSSEDETGKETRRLI